MLNSSADPESIFSHQTETEVLHPHIAYRQNDYTTGNRIHIRGYGRIVSSHKHNVRSPLKRADEYKPYGYQGR